MATTWYEQKLEEHKKFMASLKRAYKADYKNAVYMKKLMMSAYLKYNDSFFLEASNYWHDKQKEYETHK